jgi:alkylation response protein AidB-like acyl-CoA dehydrogenase
MNFGFTEQQEQLRAQAQKLLTSASPMPEVRRVAKTDSGYDAALWKQLGELGMLGLLVPERYGGAGLTWVDAVVLLEASGRALLPSPLVSQLLATSAIAALGSEEQKQRLLPKLARGELIAALALFERGGELGPGGVQLQAAPNDAGYVLSGQKAFVADAASAGLFLVAARSERGLLLGLLERQQTGVNAQAFPVIDTTKRMGTLTLDGARLEPSNVLVAAPDADGVRAYERLLDMGAVAIAAEAVGAAAAVLALTVDYAKTRRQFGSPIGKFQGVKHPLAELHVELETAKSLVYYAGWALSASPEQVPSAASMAKAQASETFARIGIDAIQLHGAIGYTDEYDAQLYLKRSKWARPQYGDADHHYDRLARLRGL